MAFPVRSTPFPNHLLDTIMPTLKDTEWRLLCVIARQTLGWQEGTGRKQQDWLTHAQLKARTGRSSEAVSSALNALVRQELVATCDADGQRLATPAQRRACAGRLYFRLGAKALPAARDAQPTKTPGRKSEERVSQSEDAKAKTTKESSYKNQPPPSSLREANAVSLNDAAFARRFLQAYAERFRQRSPHGETPPLRWERDSRLVGELLRQYGYARLIVLLDRFFHSDDPWVRKRGYALACFPVLLPALLLEHSGQPPQKPQTTEQRRQAATPVVVHGPSDEYVQQAERKSSSSSSPSLFARYPELARKVRAQPP